ncbi:MAG: hypothetical protein DME26_07015 [Verrucomicrobia bacterium]|nr:MAG: hypothetical protein DME26_07015 [Verrucomicrobiota bacterium]
MRACAVLGCIILSGVASADPPPLDLNHAKVKGVIAVQQAVTAELMSWQGVLGTAVGLNDAGEPAL